MDRKPDRDLPYEGLETPHGRLYRPLSHGRQILVLVAAFAASMTVGGWVAAIPADLSEAARVVLHIPYILVFFLGYGLWIARLNAIAFEGIGRTLLTTLWQIIVHREKPPSITDVLPSREKLLAMLVKGQKAGASFQWVG